MKDIVILSHYCGTLDGNHNSRFLELATLLSVAHSVEVITTDFMHATKQHITAPTAEYPFKITLLHEKGYPKNVCLQRFVSHHEFGKNVERYLSTRKKPDVIYCAIPSLTAPLAAAEYCKKNGVRFVIDVQDLWPEAFRMVFHVPVLSDLIFAPMVHMVNRVYAAADSICAVSETYAKRALSVNHKCTEGHSVYLGTRLANFDRLRQAEPKLIKKPGERWIGYIGTLGHSYDLTSVLDALVLLRRERGISNVRFVVMGEGPLRAQFEDYANALKLPVTFTGMLSYAEMVPLLCACDIAVNPIKAGSAGSIINKVGDYAAAGLPVVNTQECLEYRNLVTDYDMGIHCENGDVSALADAIETLLSDGAMRQRMGQNNRRLAEERFDRGVSYHELISVISDT